MEFSRRSTMGSILGSSQADSPPRSTHGHHARQMSSFSLHGGRPPSVQGSVRPSTSRSIRNIRPGTPGGSLGLNRDVKVESRPLTQQGVMTLRSNCQGPGRQVQDKSYYLSKLRTRKQELQAEIDVMNDEIDRLQKREPTNVHLEHKQKALNEEVMALKAQLGDYIVVTEMVAAGVKLDGLKEQLRSAKERNDEEKKKVDQLFSERTRKEQSYKAAEEKIQFLEAEMERRVNDEAPEIKAQYLELRDDACTLAAEVENLELEIQDVTMSAHSLEQELRLAPPVKQKAAMLMEQLLNAEAELSRLKAEEVPTVQLSPEEARGAMLLKIRQDNAEIANAEEKIKQVEDEVREYEEKIAEADKSLSELKGGRAEKFLEMQQKEKKMQAFIDSFDTMKREHEGAARLVQQRIVQLLKQTNQERASAGEVAMDGNMDSKKSQQSASANDIDDLLIVLEERQQESNQLEEVEEKNLKDLASNQEKIASLTAEIAKFGHLEDMRTQWDVKCTKLEAHKKIADENRRLLQAQLKEQEAKAESMQGILNGNEVHIRLEELKQKLSSLQKSGITLQEELDLKERETNYKPVLENIRFMVGHLNTEIKAQNTR